MVGAQRTSRTRVRALPLAERAGGSAGPYALGRRKADARPRPRPDVEGKSAADRRALTRPRAAHHAADLRQHPQGQRQRVVSVDRRRERQPRRRFGGSRLPPRARIAGAAVALAYLMHLIFIRPVIGKPGFDNSTLIATVGISIAVSAAAILIFNPEYKVVPPIISGNFTVSEVQITKQGLLVIATSLALFG